MKKNLCNSLLISLSVSIFTLFISHYFLPILSLEEFYDSNKLTWGKKRCLDLKNKHQQKNSSININTLNSGIVIVTVGDHLLFNENQRSRYKQFPDFLDKIKEIKTNSIFFDFFFNRHHIYPEFEKSFKYHKNIYAGYFFDILSPTDYTQSTLDYLEKFRLKNITPMLDSKDSYELWGTNPIEYSLELMKTIKGLSCVNVFYDSNHILSKIPLYCLYKGKLYPTAALNLAAEYFEIDIIKDMKIILGKSIIIKNIKQIAMKQYSGDLNQNYSDTIEIPIDENGLLFVDYINCAGSFPTIPIDTILNSNSHVWQSIIENKIVLVGAYSSNIDVHRTPFGQMNGIEVIANTINTIISRKFYKQSSLSEKFGTFLILGILLSFIMTFLPFTMTLLGVFLIGFLFAVENFVVFNYFHFQQPFISGIIYIFLNYLFQLIYKERTLDKYLKIR